MPRLRNPYSVWLILFITGIGLDALGMTIIAPLWVRYGMSLLGVCFLLVSIVVVGRLQRSD